MEPPHQNSKMNKIKVEKNTLILQPIQLQKTKGKTHLLQSRGLITHTQKPFQQMETKKRSVKLSSSKCKLIRKNSTKVTNPFQHVRISLLKLLNILLFSSCLSAIPTFLSLCMQWLWRSIEKQRREIQGRFRAPLHLLFEFCFQVPSIGNKSKSKSNSISSPSLISPQSSQSHSYPILFFSFIFMSYFT